MKTFAFLTILRFQVGFLFLVIALMAACSDHPTQTSKPADRASPQLTPPESRVKRPASTLDSSVPLHEIDGSSLVVPVKPIRFGAGVESVEWSRSDLDGHPSCKLRRISREISDMQVELTLDHLMPLTLHLGLTGLEMDSAGHLVVWNALNVSNEQSKFSLRCVKTPNSHGATLLVAGEIEEITDGALRVDQKSNTSSNDIRNIWTLENGIPSSDQLFAWIAPGTQIDARTNVSVVSSSQGNKQWRSEWQDGVASGESLLDKSRVTAEVRLSAELYEITKTKIFYFINWDKKTRPSFEIIVELATEKTNRNFDGEIIDSKSHEQKSFIEWTIPLSSRPREKRLEWNSFLSIFPASSLVVRGKPMPFNLRILQ